MRIDFDKLRIILLPHCLRNGGTLEALLRAMYAPLKRNNAAMQRYVSDEERERQYGPTVKQLRTALAYHLGVTPELIAFGDVANRDAVTLRRQSDASSAMTPLGTTPLALWCDDQVWWNREFTVTLPITYQANEAEVRSILDRWKMAASRYKIIYTE